MPQSPYTMMGFSDPASSLSHFLGAALFLAYAWPLIRRARGHVGWQVSLAVFVIGAVFLFSMSGVFHLLARGGEARSVLQRLDHAAIFAFIAATFTPVHAMLFRGVGRWGMLAFIWTCAAVGITLKTIYFESVPYGVGVALYIALGWVGLGSGFVLSRRYGFRFIGLMLLGGVAYSAGAVLDTLGWPVVWPGVIGSHEVFHAATLVGAACHFAFVRKCTDQALAEYRAPISAPGQGVKVVPLPAAA